MKHWILPLVLLPITWGVTSYHETVLTPPPITQSSNAKSLWLEKNASRTNQLVVEGTAYERGQMAGVHTKAILERQETELLTKYTDFFPLLLRYTLEPLALKWFRGVGEMIEPEMLAEMYGVSRSADAKFNKFGDPYQRQIYYHAIHELGQMMVDQRGEETLMGCSVAAIPYKNGWIVGRNFDFEGGRVFDDEKIMKWVFPTTRFAYVSVIWAGMVGAVTGVNEHGVYVSLNAAGSTDHARKGIPSTLVITKALETSKTAKEAVDLIAASQLFITDVFVVADPQSFYQIEKSPHHTEILPHTSATFIANHLNHAHWQNDETNLFRKNELTSFRRETRGRELIKSARTEEDVLKILRDKGELPIGHRSAIDPLIASHSVIYNSSSATLFVSQGPGVSGPYFGYDLKASFQARKPVPRRDLARDPLVSNDTFKRIRQAESDAIHAQALIHAGECKKAEPLLKSAENQESYLYHLVLGHYHSCMGEKGKAETEWKSALTLKPAYQAEVRWIEKKLKELL